MGWQWVRVGYYYKTAGTLWAIIFYSIRREVFSPKSNISRGETLCNPSPCFHVRKSIFYLALYPAQWNSTALSFLNIYCGTDVGLFLLHQNNTHLSFETLHWVTYFVKAKYLIMCLVYLVRLCLHYMRSFLETSNMEHSLSALNRF